MDAQGNAVEWWVAIKPPSTRDLLYIDSSTSEPDPTRWRFRWEPTTALYTYSCSIGTISYTEPVQSDQASTRRKLFPGYTTGLERQMHLLHALYSSRLV